MDDLVHCLPTCQRDVCYTKCRLSSLKRKQKECKSQFRSVSDDVAKEKW